MSLEFAAAFPKHAEVTLAVMSKLHAHTTIALRGLACSRTVRKRSDFVTSAARYSGFAAPRLRHAYFRPIRATLCSSGDQCRLLCIAAIHARVAICNVAEHLGDPYAESGQTLQGSFSAVSKPKFASKYSLESSCRDLHNALLCTAL